MDVQREIEVLRADLRQVRRDLKRVLQGIGSGGKERVLDTGSRWWDGGKALEARVEERVGDVLGDVGEHAKYAAQRAKEEAEEHPFLIGLAFAGLALLAYQLIAPRRW